MKNQFITDKSHNMSSAGSFIIPYADLKRNRYLNEWKNFIIVSFSLQGSVLRLANINFYILMKNKTKKSLENM